VNPNAHTYMGYTPYKMDPKYRVSIPTGWRPAAGESLYLLSSKTHEMPVIKVLSQRAFDERVKTVENSDLTPAKKTAMLGRLSMLCRAANVNDQGKLLVPKELSEAAGIGAESEVVLAGRGMHFEVWSKANHQRVLEIEQTPDEDDDLGIL
jgi:DNA-binding transcriptional regulator/RsmH inhibitor MraZ